MDSIYGYLQQFLEKAAYISTKILCREKGMHKNMDWTVSFNHLKFYKI